MIHEKEKKQTKQRCYTGWAMEAYPEMSEEEMAFHIERQVKEGANILWIGHNNPGEVNKEKVEPGLSYAVYEAYIDKNDPRHEDAVAMIEAQYRMLKVCRRVGVPVVFPVGYQIQMGERWNIENLEHLRRHFSGEVIDWGGISATFLSPKYQEDITRYYRWVIEHFVEPYKDIILMINLADEPFGGDYSHWAKEEFHRRYGITISEAYEMGNEGLVKIGEFQSRYIVDYAIWSADRWNELYPGIPTTMSFCGHHGREENHMPDICGLFKDTLPHFHPTFDVYPRDGSFQDPITEPDVTMLIIFLRQIGYLSALYQKPYWLWTTGNSWGLGQNSSDKGNISDALANQFYAISTAVAQGGDLRGTVIWNYNVKSQGLYNDTNPIVYDPDELFVKNTRFLSWLRGYLGEKNLQTPGEAALVLPREYGYRKIGKSKRCVWVKCYGLNNLHTLAKQAENFIVTESLEEVIEYDQKFPHSLRCIIFLSDAEERLSPETIGRFKQYISEKISDSTLPYLIFPTGVAEQLQLSNDSKIKLHLIEFPGEPEEISPEFWERHLSPLLSNPETLPLYRAGLNEIRMVYNLSKKEQKISLQDLAGKKIYALDLSGDPKIKLELTMENTSEGDLRIAHHCIAIAFNKETSEEDISKLLEKPKV